MVNIDNIINNCITCKSNFVDFDNNNYHLVYDNVIVRNKKLKSILNEKLYIPTKLCKDYQILYTFNKKTNNLSINDKLRYDIVFESMNNEIESIDELEKSLYYYVNQNNYRQVYWNGIDDIMTDALLEKNLIKITNENFWKL